MYLTVFLLAVITLIGLLIYAGLLEKFTIKVNERSNLPFDRMLILYRPHVGEYRNICMAFKEIAVLLATIGKANYRTFGIYYDDPAKCRKCRYITGVVLAEGDEIELLSQEKSEIADFFKRNGFNEAILPKIDRCLYTTFPLRCGFLSIWMAVSTVYSALGIAIKKISHETGNESRGILELYEKDTIHYVFHLDKPAEKFMVPELKYD